jgi:transcription-repair coupling factor (superfamily II helicase)
VAKLSGLLTTSDPELGALAAASRDLRPAGVPALAVEGPAALRPFLAAALTDGGRTVLAVTATDREAEDLAAAAGDLLDRAAVAVLPSWETLPHERLSPRPDTVGRRLSIFRSLADPATAPRLVVAAARSLIQPIAPGLGRLEPVTLRVGDEHDFDDLLVRLVELAYTRVEMVTARGEFAVRGGIVDVFPPTAEHPVRVEFWGDEISDRSSPSRSCTRPGAGSCCSPSRCATGPRRSPGPTRTTPPCASCWSASPRASRRRAWSR